MQVVREIAYMKKPEIEGDIPQWVLAEGGI